MIIIPNRQSTDLLELNAFSAETTEFNAVSSYLNINDFSYSAVGLERDKFERKGMRFSIFGYFQISRLEELLGIGFERAADKTITVFKKVSGTRYKCVRIRDQGWQNDCKEVTAPNDHAAYLKCTIIAGEENWLGVTSELGKCP